MLDRAGVPILVGTDAANGATAGVLMDAELETVVKAGLSPADALADATSVPAKIFSLNDRGRIAPGLRADLLLIRGDPTVDISATKDIVAIWKQGVRFDRDAFRESIAQRNEAWRFGRGWWPWSDVQFGGNSKVHVSVASRRRRSRRNDEHRGQCEIGTRGAIRRRHVFPGRMGILSGKLFWREGPYIPDEGKWRFVWNIDVHSEPQINPSFGSFYGRERLGGAYDSAVCFRHRRARHHGRIHRRRPDGTVSTRALAISIWHGRVDRSRVDPTVGDTGVKGQVFYSEVDRWKCREGVAGGWRGAETRRYDH